MSLKTGTPISLLNLSLYFFMKINISFLISTFSCFKKGGMCTIKVSKPTN